MFKALPQDYVSSVQFSHSVVSDSLWTHEPAAHQASLSITNSWSLPKLMSVESVMPSNHLILCRPLLLLPSIFPSIRVFSKEWPLHIRWPQDWSFSISPSNEYSGLTSFRIDCWSPCSPRDSQESAQTPRFRSISWFFSTQPSLGCSSHSYRTIGEATTFVGKMMSVHAVC